MKFLIVAMAFFGIGKLTASEIRWTARGTVSTVGGGAFSGTGVGAGDPVEITMVYDSALLVSKRSGFPVNGAFFGEARFYGAANLGISVKIGGNTWTGQMPNAPSNSSVMGSVCWDNGGPSDRFNVTLDAARGGTFPDFPHTGAETTRALALEFRDDTSLPELFDVHVLPDSITNVCAMTSATGSIVAGTSTIAFAIDPTSARVTRPLVPVSIARSGAGIKLSWETVLGKSYRIEGSSDLICWSWEGEYSGTGTIRMESLTPFEIDPKRFYRIAEL